MAQDQQDRSLHLLDEKQKMKIEYLLIISLVFLVGCVGTHRNKQDVNQGAPRLGVWPDVQGEELPPPKKENVPAKEITAVASNNANEQSQTGAVNLALGKFAEVLRTELNGVKAEISTQVQQEFKFQTTASAAVAAELKSEIRAEINQAVSVAVNQKVEAFKNSQLEALTGVKNDISKFQQELTAGRDIHNQTIQFSKEFQQALKDSHESHMYTIEKFIWLLGQLATAFFLYLRFSRKLDSQEEMALIKGKREKHAE